MEVEYEFGSGWNSLVLEAEALVDKYNTEHPNEEYPLEFVQIKEKWGGLRIYLNYYPDNIDVKLNEIENRSHTVCEHCGTTKNVTREWTHGWVMTLCPKCRQEELEIYNKKYEKVIDNI